MEVIIGGDPFCVVVVKGYWHQFSSGLPCIEELPGLAEVLCSIRTPPTTTEHVLWILIRVYAVEGRLPAPKSAGLTSTTGLGLGKTASAAEGGGLSSEPQASPSPKGGPMTAKGEVMKREESQKLDVAQARYGACSRHGSRIIVLHFRVICNEFPMLPFPPTF